LEAGVLSSFTGTGLNLSLANNTITVLPDNLMIDVFYNYV
jgi:hypothetical protein